VPRDAHSPSSIALGARCQRAWAYRYIAGLREPDLSWAAIQAGAPCTNRQRSLALGKAIHATIERWYGHADPTDPAGEGAGSPGAPNWDWFPGQVAWGGSPWLPEPSACSAVRVEEPIALEAHGVRWAGRRDLIVLPEPDEARRIGLPPGWVLIDHKSSSNPARYALTPERLRVDVQACTYALATLDELGAPSQKPLPLRWIYYDTRPAQGTRTAPRVARSRSLAVDAAVTRAEALAVLASSDDDLLAVLAAAYRVRHRWFGREMILHVLRNAKSGICTEDCAFCSQSASARTDIERYPVQAVEEIAEGAREAQVAGALRYCVVTSARAPTERELATACEAAKRIKRTHPHLQLCWSMGLLNEAQARRLKAAGVDRYNHNLETSERFFPRICTTHTYADRLATTRAAKAAGLELCCGGLLGMGEDAEDRVDLAFALRRVDADSIPVNLLDPRPGTALEKLPRMTPTEGLRTLAMFRFVHPRAEVRIAGGREAVLGPLQPLAFYAVNSMFTRGYLTTGGQGLDADRAMVEAIGFQIRAVVES